MNQQQRPLAPAGPIDHQGPSLYEDLRRGLTHIHHNPEPQMAKNWVRCHKHSYLPDTRLTFLVAVLVPLLVSPAKSGTCIEAWWLTYTPELRWHCCSLGTNVDAT